MPNQSTWALICMCLCTCVMHANAKAGGVCKPSTGREFEIATTEKTFTIRTQDDVNDLIADCTTLDGNVDIVCDASSDITNLEVFQFVTTITGYLRVESCDELTTLRGFRSLQSVNGETLFDSGAANGAGFAIYVKDNPLLSSLSGLEALRQVSGSGALGLGKVLIQGNDNLCYLDTIDWDLLIGSEDAWRVNKSVSTEKDCTSASSCHLSCSCSSCVGPTEQECQTICIEDDKSDSIIIAVVVVFCCVFGLVVLLMFLVVTGRCGCRLKMRESVWQIGLLEDTNALIHATGPPQAPSREKINDPDPFSRIGKTRLQEVSQRSGEPSTPLGLRGARRVHPSQELAGIE
eukprot:m.363424 g.363424  ORF g.363424 m.363424 type:complete len:348 (-) comp22464_c0_seq1:157-1200(-)